MGGDIPPPSIVKLSIKEVDYQTHWSLAQQIADSNFEYVNWIWPEGKDKFPHDFRMWSVDKYFPEAKGGPLLMDTPRFESEITKCHQKASALHELGYRYLILTPDMSFEDAMLTLSEQA